MTYRPSLYNCAILSLRGAVVGSAHNLGNEGMRSEQSSFGKFPMPTSSRHPERKGVQNGVTT